MLKDWQVGKKEGKPFIGYVKKKRNIYFLQETHCSEESVSNFQKDWGGDCLFCNKNSSSAGVMILFNLNFEYKIENVIKDNDGRFLICTVVINQENIVLANCYGLKSDETFLLEDVCNELEQLNDMPMICGGRLNLDLENIDKKGGSSLLSHKKNRETKTLYTKK